MITIGADIEAFIYDGNKLVEADLLIPDNNKSNPIDFYGYIITHDRKAIEVGIKPYIFGKDTLFELRWRLGLALNALDTFVKEFNKNYRIVLKDAVVLNKPSTFNKGFELNIYKEIPTGEITNNICTAGFHIHFSGDLNKIKLIRDLDKSIGWYYKTVKPFSIRKDYGELGTYKDKQYDIYTQGFEYRVLGASMLKEPHLTIINHMLNKKLIKHDNNK